MAQRIRESAGVLRTVPPIGTPTLPKKGELNILITSALPYCNNVPHLGNIIGSTLSADVFSRYNRARDRRTLYVCGTDEYGTATETQALKEGITPRALCDKYTQIHAETYKWFELGFDHFGRTSTPHHTEICQEIYRNLSKNGALERKVTEQVYCETCQKWVRRLPNWSNAHRTSRFLADRFVEGTCPYCGSDDARGDQCDSCSRTIEAVELVNPRCLVSKDHKVSTRSSSHMYISLDKIQPQTEAWIKASYKRGKWSPNSVINTEGEITDARLKGGLRPSPVTRDLQWGVPVPPTGGSEDDEMRSKVLYVWFDAPIGYPSITSNFTPEWRQWWFNQEDVKLYQFMGKDNTFFHTVYFPSVQIGDGRPWTTLHHVSTTEFLNYEGGKFSKRHNRGVFGPAAKETGIPASVWRYYLLSTRPETGDSMFSWADCVSANNNVLLNNLGNFINRVLKFTVARYESEVPDSGDTEGVITASGDDPDKDFVAEVNRHLTDYLNAMEAVKLRLGLSTAMLLSGRGNLYLQQAGLNNALLADNPKRCAQVVARALNLIYILSAVIYPFMPSTSESILQQLNTPARTIPDKIAIDLLPGHTIGKPEHLFKSIKESQIEVWRTQFSGSKPVGSAVATAAADGAPAAASADAPLSKRKAAAAQKAAARAAAESSGLKSPEVIELEGKIAAQGNIVRNLKLASTKPLETEAELAKAIEELKKLKLELTQTVNK